MKERGINHHLLLPLSSLFVVGTLIFGGNVFGAASAVEGVVKDANGRPVSGANVRVEARNGSSSNKVVRSDTSGHYIFDGLTPGATYRVTLLINGAIKASINNVLAKSGSIQLNFDLRTTSLSGNPAATTKGKHYVYIPAETGSHLGGRWVEVDENGQSDSIGVNNVERANSEALRRMQSNSGAVGGIPGSGR
jgi:hypothetical protein